MICAFGGDGAAMFVTDGCFMFYDRAGALCMLWSSRIEDSYVTAIARSESGRLEGPWTHDERPLYAHDGGHPMLFKTLEGRDMITFHQPDRLGLERMMILPVSVTDHGLEIIYEVRR